MREPRLLRMSSLLFGVTVIDPVTFAAVPVLLGIVALGACLVPAKRHSRFPAANPALRLTC